MVYNLACNDVFYRTTADTFTYTIRLSDGEAVYFGTAVKSPGSPYIEININRVASQYLDVDMPDFREYSNNITLHGNGFLDFKLYQVVFNEVTVAGQTTKVATENLLETYRFLYGYDYLDTWNGGRKILSNPVNGVMDPRMKLFFSAYNSAVTSVSVTSVCGVPAVTPSTGSTPSWDSGSTPDAPVSYNFTLLSGNGAQMNSTTGTWTLDYDTNYPSVYYVFSGTTGVQTGYTSGNNVSFFIPQNSGGTRTWSVQFYPMMGGTLLTGATATQTSSTGDTPYTFAFNNTEGEAISSASTSNTVTWTSTYPSVNYAVYREGVLIGSGVTSQSGVTVVFPLNDDVLSGVGFSFTVSYMGDTLGTLTWTQGQHESGGGGGSGDLPTSGPLIFKVKPVGYKPADGNARKVVGGLDANYSNIPGLGRFLYIDANSAYTEDGWECLPVADNYNKAYPEWDSPWDMSFPFKDYRMHYANMACVLVLGDYYRPGYMEPFSATSTGYHVRQAEIPEGIQILGMNGMYGDNAYIFPSTLEYLKLPSTIREINAYVFSHCTNLTSIYFNGTKLLWSEVWKSDYWKQGSAITTIHCVDGDVSV